MLFVSPNDALKRAPATGFCLQRLALDPKIKDWFDQHAFSDPNHQYFSIEETKCYQLKTHTMFLSPCCVMVAVFFTLFCVVVHASVSSNGPLLLVTITKGSADATVASCAATNGRPVGPAVMELGGRQGRGSGCFQVFVE